MTTMNRSETQTPPQLNQLQLVALIIGIIGVALLALGAVLDIAQFFRSYLFGYIFALSLPLGCLGWLMIQHVTLGTWGLSIRRMLEAGAVTIPIMALAFIPIAIAVTGEFAEQGILYVWTSPEEIATNSFVAHKQPWLSPPWFLGRAVIYFVVWITLALFLRRWSLEEDRTGDRATYLRMRRLSAGGLVLFVLTVTFAMFDWGMSLMPEWFSTMYGVIFMVGYGLTTVAFMIVMLRLLMNTEPLAEFVGTKQIHDLGKLMLAFTILWTYVSFGQYVIIWSGDIAEFTPWYVERANGGWEWISLALLVFLFAVPFIILLSRQNKRNIKVLVWVALWIIFMRFVDIAWLILPHFHESVAGVSWMDFAAPLGLFGIWIALFLLFLKRNPLMPLKDPKMEEFAHGGHH